VSLLIKDLSKSFAVNHETVVALKNINLTVEDGEFITIVGHSGCGKSTLLKIIAGLQSYEIGQVLDQDRQITGPGPDRGMVFQEHRLLPWLTIAENVGFGLKNLPRAEWEKLVADHLRLVKLEAFAKAYPHQLSGGMAQRAAIARGLVNNPRILLLDEPFGALDALTRIQMQKEVLRIWEQERTTMILVTHDIDEAIYLGQRTIVLSSRPGEIKAIIDVDTAHAKDRGSSEFGQIKKKILGYFFEEDEIALEYAI
jgi:sulfonate transport system ATP-binding protein